MQQVQGRASLQRVSGGSSGSGSGFAAAPHRRAAPRRPRTAAAAAAANAPQGAAPSATPLPQVLTQQQVDAFWRDGESVACHTRARASHMSACAPPRHSTSVFHRRRARSCHPCLTLNPAASPPRSPNDHQPNPTQPNLNQPLNGKKGFLAVPGFASPEEVAAMRARAEALVDAFDPASISIFSTRDDNQARGSGEAEGEGGGGAGLLLGSQRLEYKMQPATMRSAWRRGRNARKSPQTTTAAPPPSNTAAFSNGRQSVIH